VGGHFLYYSGHEPTVDDDFWVPSRAALAPLAVAAEPERPLLGTACDVFSLASCLCLLYVIPILCGAWALPPKSLLQNRCFSAPLTALHATGRSVVDVAEENMEGRHVGLDFYDLLIEA
jgi:hypothetical protein